MNALKTRVNRLLAGASAVAALAAAGVAATAVQGVADKWLQLVVVVVLGVAGVVGLESLDIELDPDSVVGLALRAVSVGAVLGWLLGWIAVSVVTVLFIAGAVVVVLSVFSALFGDLPDVASWLLTAATVGLVWLKGASVVAWLGVAGVGGLSLLGWAVAVLLAVRVRAVVSGPVSSSVEGALGGGWSGVLSV